MKTAKTQTRRSRRGLVLPLALAIALILAILSIGLLRLGLGSRVNAALITAGLSARAAADAGITHALYRMNAALNFDGTINPALWPPNVSGVALRPASDTSFSYTITSPDNVTYWEIISTGTVNRADRQIRTVHAITRRQSYWFGVGVKDKFYLMPGGTFDTFPEGSAFEGSVRTNGIDISPGDIGLYSGTNIPGNVLVGPTDTVEPVVHNPGGGNPGTIDGTLSAADSELSFPDAELPPADKLPPGGWQLGPALLLADYLDTGEIDLATGYPIKRKIITSGPSGIAYVYSDLTVPNFGGGVVWELRLVGGFVINVTAKMIIEGDARLTIGDGVYDPLLGDHLDLYLGSSGPVVPSNFSSFDARTDSTIFTLPRALGELPHSVDLKIYGLPTCTTNSKVDPAITLHNSSTFWGVIYAPDAPISVHNSGLMYGSFIGFSMNLDNSGAFYYDSRIPSEQNEGPMFFEIERWWEEAGSPAGGP